MATSIAASGKSVWGFSPQSIPGLQLWLDGADQSSMVLSGTSITTWTNKGASRGSATTTTTLGTITSTGSINSRPAVSVGTNARMTMPSLTFTQTSRTVFVVSTLGGSSGFYIFLDGVANSLDVVFFSINGLLNMGIVGVTAALTATLPGGVFNSPSIICGVSAPASNIGLYVNGTALTLATNTGGTYIAGTSTTQVTGSAAFEQPYTLGEIMFFDGALTTQQQQQVEGYLASKWGLHNQLPTTHPYSSVVPILPTQIPGCVLWLDAADSSTITGTSPVTLWKDKSGNANNGIPNSTGPTLVQNVKNGLPGITFPTIGSVMTCGNLMSGTNFSLFAVVKYDPGNSANQVAVNEWKRRYGSVLTFDKASSITASVADSTTYSAFGPITAADTANFHIYAGSLSSSTSSPNATLIAGTDGNDSTYTSTGGPNTAGTQDQFSVGGDLENGSFFYPLTGYICEVIFYNVALSNSQMTLIEQYLGKKWGISVANAPSPGPYLIPFNRPFYPTDIPGCSLWLDGGDTSSMTFSPGTSNVTTWKDKSGNGLNATQRSGKDAGVYSSTTNCINFTTAATAYDTSYPANPTSETMFVVANNASPSGYNNAVIGGPKGSRSLSFGYSGLSPAATGRHGYINTRQEWLASTPASSYTSGQTAIVAGNVSGGSTFISTQGSNMSSGVPITLALSNVNTIIGIDSTDSQIYFTGSVMEIIFYNNTVLSTPQRQQVEQYLANKWGLVSSLPTGHPGKLMPAFSTNFTVKSIPGCTLWLDAADSSSITLSGGTTTLTQWNDKSGNGNNATAGTTSPVYVSSGINGMGVISFNGSTSYLNSQDLFSARSFAIFMIIRKQAAIGNAVTVALLGGTTLGTNQNLILAWGYDTTFTLSFFGNDLNYYSFPAYTGNPATEPAYLIGVTYTPGARVLYVNAKSVASDTNSTNIVSDTGAAIGSWYIRGSDRTFNGFIGETLILNGSITTSQRQQVEGYLAWKWGLQSSLPSTHAYAKFSP